MNRKALPSTEWLWESFSYDPLRGELYWRKPRKGVSTKRPAGYIAKGYRRIGAQKFLAHRLIFKWVYGRDPSAVLDHKGQEDLLVKSDHCWGLEEVTQAENLRRACNGKGYYWHKQRRKWMTKVRWDGVYHYLGIFDSEQEAIQTVHSFRETRL